MSEVGLVPFARVALEVSREVLPAYSHRFSPQRFTQPQLLAILCLMRYEEWTFRAAEVRLVEHAELRKALELEVVPDYSTLFRFMLRIEEELIAQVLGEVVRRLEKRNPPPAQQDRAVAVDATGLAPGAISTFFIRRREHRGGSPTPYRYWLKWLVAVDTRLRLILAQKAHAGPTNDCATLPSLLDQVAEGPHSALEWCWPMRSSIVSATISTFANNSVPLALSGAKRSKVGWKLTGVRAQMRSHFPAAPYRQRVQAESVFSSIKRKLSSKAPGRSLATQRKQALLLGLAYNIYKLWPPHLRCPLPA
jgi:Transposase domain (DUF772)